MAGRSRHASLDRCRKPRARDLIAVLDADVGFWFVGQSGTSYEAREPLAAFVRSSAPLEPLVRVSAARRSIVGIPADHSLSRSTDGAASFTRVGPRRYLSPTSSSAATAAGSRWPSPKPSG